MSSRLEIPKGAVMIDSFGGTIPTGPYAGRHYAMYLFDGLASKGAKSNFQRVPTRWLEYVISATNGEQVKRGAFSYSGKRYAQGLVDFRKNRVDFEKALACPPPAQQIA